jgi:hypothetical protein
MELYADPDSCNGILKPSGIAEIKFRLFHFTHSINPQLLMLDSELDMIQFDSTIVYGRNKGL